MMEATLAWSWTIGANRPVGRGLWTWLDLADPDDGPAVLAGGAARDYWPLPADRTIRVDHPAALVIALRSRPSFVAFDESVLDDDAVVAAVVGAVETGATIMIGRDTDGARPRLRSPSRRIVRRSAANQVAPTRSGIERLVASFETPVPIGRLVPVDDAEPGDPSPAGHGAARGPSILALPDVSSSSGPSLHRWRAVATNHLPCAPLVILARPWHHLPPTVGRMTGAGPGSSRPSSDADVSWEFGPPRGYATQKSVLFVVGATEMVVKQSRDALGAERLAVEIDALRQLHARSLTGDPDDQVVVPEVLADHRSPGRTVVAESSLAGDSLLDHLSAGGRATDAAPLVDFLIGLAIESAADTDSGARSAAFGSVADRFATTFPLHRRTAARVRAAAARIVDVGVPSVQLHGDFTPWNVVRTEAGWAVHDWENADPAGPPLWDLVLLMIGVAGAVERSANLRRLVEGLTASGPTHDVLAEWTGRYCAAVGVEPALVPDLWVTLLAHQAVKEASRSRRLRTIRVRSLRLLVSLDRPANLPGGRTA